MDSQRGDTIWQFSDLSLSSDVPLFTASISRKCPELCRAQGARELPHGVLLDVSPAPSSPATILRASGLGTTVINANVYLRKHACDHLTTKLKQIARVYQNPQDAAFIPWKVWLRNSRNEQTIDSPWRHLSEGNAKPSRVLEWPRRSLRAEWTQEHEPCAPPFSNLWSPPK